LFFFIDAALNENGTILAAMLMTIRERSTDQRVCGESAL
jgi:hypothetical protein